MSDYGSSYEELIRKITSIDSLKNVTRVPSEGAFQKNRPFSEEAKQTEIQQSSNDADALQTKTAVYVSANTAKIENTNLKTYSKSIFTGGSSVNLFINGVSINDTIYSFNFESPDLIITFNIQLLGFNIDSNDDIKVVGVFIN